ncbi:MAG: PBS lyase [Desulfobacteraceae bacterium]|nr:PBS lyase [Desulfobacteraceae bacterium]
MAKPACVPVKPWCPFCGQDVPPPEALRERKMVEFTQGACPCGAVFVSDQTGHNLGSAMVECLVLACHGNWELAWDLTPEEDYLTGQVDNYDELTHQVIETRNLEGRAVRGVLYFVRLHRDVAQLAAQVGEPAAGETYPTPPVWEPARRPGQPRQRATKPEVKRLADAGEVDNLAALCLDDAKTMRYLQRLLYDPVPERRWHYATVMGQVCARYASRKPGAVSDLLHRLFEACSDSAATHWGLIEAVGAIIAGRPDLFGAFARHLLMFRNLPTTRVQTLWALAEIAKTRPDIVRATPFFSLYPMLAHSDPETRGHAVFLFGLIKASEARSQIEALANDGALLSIYDGVSRHEQTTVAALARQALERLTAGKENQGGEKK